MGAQRTAPRNQTPALDALAPVEKGALLDSLLAARPDLREQAEVLAQGRLTDEQRQVVAAEVEDALRFHDIDEINNKAGYRPGRGYVHPNEAADEILDEALQPFLDDLDRRAKLGLAGAAVELAIGIVCGLYECREAGSESLLEYAPDFAIERAGNVIDRCAQLDVTLPVDDLLLLIPEWDCLLYLTDEATP